MNKISHFMSKLMNLDNKGIHLCWLGQMGLVVKAEGKLLCFDPFISEHKNRLYLSPITATDLGHMDYVFGTHDHTDHIDRKAWKIAAAESSHTKFVVPRVKREQLSEELNIPMERLIGIDDQKEVKLEGLSIQGIASAHEFLDYDDEKQGYPYMGYFVKLGQYTIYHSGDTCIYKGLQDKLEQCGHINFIMLPINGRDAKRYMNNTIGNMTYQEAVDLAGTIKPDYVIPGHFDMFEKNSENPFLFLDYLKVKYKTQNVILFTHGEIISF